MSQTRFRREPRAPRILNRWLTQEVRDAKAVVKQYLHSYWIQCNTANNKIPFISEVQSVVPTQAAQWAPIRYSPCPCEKDRIRGQRNSPYKVPKRLVIDENRTPPDSDEELRPIALVGPYKKEVPWYEKQIAIHEAQAENLKKHRKGARVLVGAVNHVPKVELAEVKNAHIRYLVQHPEYTEEGAKRLMALVRQFDDEKAEQNGEQQLKEVCKELCKRKSATYCRRELTKAQLPGAYRGYTQALESFTLKLNELEVSDPPPGRRPPAVEIVAKCRHLAEQHFLNVASACIDQIAPFESALRYLEEVNPAELGFRSSGHEFRRQVKELNRSNRLFGEETVGTPKRASTPRVTSRRSVVEEDILLLDTDSVAE